LEECPIVGSSERIPTTPLVAAGAFPVRLSATRVAAAIARGLEQGGLPAADVCAIPAADELPGQARAFLDAVDFDPRMRRARAVIIGASCLRERALAGSAAFEIATRARQAGVPAYAITGENRLNSFDARILDLQAIFEATGTRALTAAGRKLARLI
jgi:glycerate kinase